MRIALFVCVLLIQLAFPFKVAPNAVYTLFTAYYPSANLGGQKIYIRGDNCNLTWTKGVVMNQTAPNEWKTAMLCTENVTINVKLLLGDTTWMLGKN